MKVSTKQITSRIESIFAKRVGGATNFRGIHFQVLYACFLILNEFKRGSEAKAIQMEGIEDIDLHSNPSIQINSEYIQLKSSINKMDAGTFWNLGIIQNFFEVYATKPESRFKLVYNMKIADGNLTTLINRKTGHPIPEFWMKKLLQLDQIRSPNDFIDKISFEPQSVSGLYERIRVLLYKEWKVNIGTESQFLNALFYNILIWSEKRSSINRGSINRLFQQIRDSFSKSPLNKAIENNWIEKVTYLNSQAQPNDGYYDGKAARPFHIVQGLPVRRKSWESKIYELIKESDITVIKSSSGQGKSTLAWQVGYNIRQNYNVYELNSCRDKNEANSTAEFLESRISIGEVPLLIIDGLDSSLSFWSSIAEKVSNFPVKILMTTRYEDWFRFGADTSRVKLTHVEILLSTQEAKDIFEQLKKKNRIYNTIKEWQPIWEQVHPKGLLIEYVYLLTKGQMIQERLETQIKTLNQAESSGAKIEILRMISLADCLNMKLETARLMHYIKSEIGFQEDRDLLLAELEREYFVNFDGRFVQGLHPVRSSHLKDILHSNWPIEESLLNLFRILNNDYKHDFFINSFLLITYKNKRIFYEKFAGILSAGNVSDMVFAMDGIMHSEPQRYWLANKEIFDKAYEIGGIDLFSMTTIPFTQHNSLRELSKLLGDKGSNIQRLDNLKNDLPAYSFENTDLGVFARCLRNQLANRTMPITSYQGLEFLVKWFNALHLSIKLPFVQNKIDIDELVGLDIQEAKELMLYFQISDPTGFRRFINKNREEIISYLKVSTNSLTIEEDSDNIFIQYILPDNEVDKANEFSVFRIQVIHAFLPFYQKYNTEAILLPFPTEQIISFVKQSSIKHLTSESIGSMFDIHLNRIWSFSIRMNYQETSSYHWQKNILDLRRISIEWAKNIVRLIDSLLEGNTKKKSKVIPAVEQISSKVSNGISLKKAYPKYQKKYFEPSSDFPEEQEINSWFLSLGNINSQLLNIFMPKEPNDRNVALINLKAVYLNLQKMQEAYDRMENKTIPYFDTVDTCKKELKVFGRLYITVQYYVNHIPLENRIALQVAKKTVEEWWRKVQNKVLNELKKELNLLELECNYRFILPNELEETETLTYATFGIIDFDFYENNALFQLSLDLAQLSYLNIDFFSIISIKDNIAYGGIRFQKDYFDAFNKLQSGEENIDLDGLSPLPLFVDEKIISTLPNVELPKPTIIDREKENQINILFELWKLSEHRFRLNIKSKIEMDWLKDIESSSKQTIDEIMKRTSNSDDDFIKFVNNGLKPNVVHSQKEILDQLHQISFNYSKIE